MSGDAGPAWGVTAVMLPEFDLPEQLSLCRELGLTHYCPRPRVIPPGQRGQAYSNWGNHKFDLTPRRLAEEGQSLRRVIEDAGCIAYATVPASHSGMADADLRLDFEGAQAVGAKAVRLNPAGYPSDKVFNYEEMLARTVERYSQLVALAKPYGVKLVMETHAGSFVASPALAWNVVRHFDPAEVGVIFDLPNFAREGNLRPTLAVSVIGRWIDHCHVGGCRRVDAAGGVDGRDAEGFRRVEDRMCPLGESDLHAPTWLGVLRAAGVIVPMISEDYTPGLSGAQRLRDCVARARAAWG